MIARMRRIERACYPEGMRQLGDVRTWADLREYAEGEPTVIMLANGYLIVTDDEIVDFAVDGRLSIPELFRVFRFLREHFSGREVLADLRERTSYRLVRALRSRGDLDMEILDTYEWCGETMYEVSLRF